MKRTILVVMLFVFAAVEATAQMPSSKKPYSFSNLVGSWRTRRGTGLDVVDSSTIYLVAGEKRREIKITKADFSKNPVWLDVSSKDSATIITLKSLLLFVNDNTLQWQVFDAETQPVSFRYSRGDMMYMRRLVQLTN